MVNTNLLKKYFNLSTEQEQKLLLYSELLLDWNKKINLISRKDTESVLEKHIIHSLGIYKLNKIKPGFDVLDVGTGGGLPGIPLSIVYPNSNFTLVDSVSKKIMATKDIVENLELQNVVCINARAESLQKQFDIITGRAVTRLSDFYLYTRNQIFKQGKYLLLKGGDLDDEIKEFEKISRLKVKQHSLFKIFSEPFFETKFVLEIDNKR